MSPCRLLDIARIEPNGDAVIVAGAGRNGTVGNGPTIERSQINPDNSLWSLLGFPGDLS
jgi:hypothetical protein